MFRVRARVRAAAWTHVALGHAAPDAVDAPPRALGQVLLRGTCTEKGAMPRTTTRCATTHRPTTGELPRANMPRARREAGEFGVAPSATGRAQRARAVPVQREHAPQAQCSQSTRGRRPMWRSPAGRARGSTQRRRLVQSWARKECSLHELALTGPRAVHPWRRGRAPDNPCRGLTHAQSACQRWLREKPTWVSARMA